jgi:hypothetical protein
MDPFDMVSILQILSSLVCRREIEPISFVYAPKQVTHEDCQKIQQIELVVSKWFQYYVPLNLLSAKMYLSFTSEKMQIYREGYRYFDMKTGTDLTVGTKRCISQLTTYDGTCNKFNELVCNLEKQIIALNDYYKLCAMINRNMVAINTIVDDIDDADDDIDDADDDIDDGFVDVGKVVISYDPRTGTCQANI